MIITEEFWNLRYSNSEYAYGTQPNEFFKQQLIRLTPAQLLLPCEGEGRNAVFAASQQWEVIAVDQSTEGKEKTQRLAQGTDVSVNYILADCNAIDFPKNRYDCVGLIFAHFAPVQRRSFHQKIVQTLKPEGTIILEAFSKAQVGKDSGGPKTTELLYTIQELKEDFKGLEILYAKEEEVILDEGEFHSGTASVVRLVASKRKL